MTASLPVELDFLGLKCPMPIVKLAKASRKHAGKSLIVRADDPAFPADLKVWCEQTGMAIANLECEGKVYTATLEPQGES